MNERGKKPKNAKKSPVIDVFDIPTSLTKCARLLGVAQSLLSKQLKLYPGFPWEKDGKKVIPRKVMVWRTQNIRERKPTPEQAQPTSASVMPVAEPTPEEAARTLASLIANPKSTALDITRATVFMAAQQVVKAGASPNSLDALKKTLQELRQAEAGYVELEKSKRELISRPEVVAIVGACCSRLVRAATVLESAIATEFAVWLANPKLKEMAADTRARLVRAFVSKTCREVRSLEAEGVEKLLEPKSESGDDE